MHGDIYFFRDIYRLSNIFLGITPVDVEEGLFRYVGGEGAIMSGGSAVQILWINEQKKNPLVPRIEVNRTSDVNRQLGLSADALLQSSLVLTVVTKAGSFIGIRSGIIQSIYEKFPVYKEIGNAIIIKLPEIRPGFFDDEEFRTPVFIEYTAIIEA